MRESYCGKNCAECARREELNCPGCRPEEGRRVPASCIIAACCNKSGHETCESCIHKQNFCQTLKEKDDYPQRHIREAEAAARKREEERQKMQERRARGVFLLKHFNILCVLWTIGLVLGLIDLCLGEDSVFGYMSDGVSLASLFVIYDMAKINGKYKTVVYIGLLAAVANLILNLAGDNMGTGLAILLLLLSLPSIYGTWLEFSTHGEVLWGIHDEVAAKWEKLAKWYVWAGVITMAGMFLMMLLPVFAFVMLAGTIGAVVVSILQVIRLFETRMSLVLYVEANVPKA